MDNRSFKTRIMTAFAEGRQPLSISIKAFWRSLKVSDILCRKNVRQSEALRHSEGTKVTEESLACHCEDERSEDVTIQTQKSDYQINNTGLSRSQRSLTVTRGFTLAETLIVLVILGVIASITIPAVVRNQIEAQNRTKIKKCMTVYDTALNKMVVENGLKSNSALTDWGNNNNCVNTKQYFKVAQDDKNGNNCIFKSADGVWWNIEDITHPIIAFDDDDLTDEIASGDTYKAFKLVGYIDGNGILRVDDKGYENGQENNIVYQNNMEKLYAFIENREMADVAAGSDVCDAKCLIDKYKQNTCQENNPYTYDVSNHYENISSCVYTYRTYEGNGDNVRYYGTTYVVDENNNLILRFAFTPDNYSNNSYTVLSGVYTFYEYDENKDLKSTKRCDMNQNNCECYDLDDREIDCNTGESI